jgi:O-glycosyl hydrolase
MGSPRLLFAAVTLLLFVSASPGNAATVTIDMDSTGQTIDGFGGFGAMRPWFGGSSTFWTDSWLNTIIDDIGMTMFRTEFSPLPDQRHNWNKQPPYWRALKAKADTSGEPLRVIATVWTPPKQFKHRIEAGSLEHRIRQRPEHLG